MQIKKFSYQSFGFISLCFALGALLVLVYGGNFLFGIPSIDVFFAFVALSYLLAFTGLMKNTKSIFSWLVLIIVSILLVCVIYFVSNFI